MDLKSLYNDRHIIGSLSGQNQLTEALRKVDPFIRRKDVINYLKSDDAYIHYTNPYRNQNVIDVVDMSSLLRQNSEYKWIINCVDTFQKTKQKTMVI